MIHELSTPLTVIGGYAEMLADRLDTDASARAGVAAIERNVQKLGQLVTALADARDNIGASPNVAVDVTALLGALSSELDGEFADRVVTWHLPTTPLVVENDPAGLRQIVVNLLDNAVKFSPAATHIEIDVHEDAHLVQVRVVDHGPGVAAERASELFGRFARLASTRRGLGLGLYLSRAIARRHGGDVAYEPTPGGGATFVLTVPRRAESPVR